MVELALKNQRAVAVREGKCMNVGASYTPPPQSQSADEKMSCPQITQLVILSTEVCLNFLLHSTTDIHFYPKCLLLPLI